MGGERLLAVPALDDTVPALRRADPADTAAVRGLGDLDPAEAR